MNDFSSAYDGSAMTVSDVLKDPTFLQTRITEELDGAFVENLLFRNGGQNSSGVVAFREAASTALQDGPEEVAEFAEIPTTVMSLGSLKSAFARKRALGVRISYEMLREDQMDVLSQQVTLLNKKMVRDSVRMSLNALNAAVGENEKAATAAWASSDSDIVKDVFDAIERVQAATVEGKPNEYFGYEPDVLLLHPVVLSKLLRDEKISRSYVGDMAHENPIYKKLLPTQLFGLNVATSRYMPATEAWVLESGSVGFYSDTIPLTVTETYAERGDSDIGGATMSWRTDAVIKRAIAVDNPKAVAKITSIGK
ncbi:MULTISPECIES: hypothetical protein [Corynebacterium]|uniref:phage major capsid protein n=1 Tax=Corynebacterium TaxID=1716 RepID=UPI00124BD47A|nr:MULTISPECIES: hypothetical protein [Corynebacterium]